MAESVADIIKAKRREWSEDRRSRPIGFITSPVTNHDGTLNIFNWECAVPGKDNILWRGGLFKVYMYFKPDFPSSAPLCTLAVPLFHPNVYPNGAICCPLLLDNKDWKPSTSIKDILEGIQHVLAHPDLGYRVNEAAHRMYLPDREQYDTMVMESTWKYSWEEVHNTLTFDHVRRRRMGLTPY